MNEKSVPLSVPHIKESINNDMQRLGLLTIIRKLCCTFSLASVFIAIYYFLKIFWAEELNESVIIAILIFMGIAIVFIIFYTILVNVCDDIKRRIYNNKRRLRKILKK
jgi:hypothetical protein